MCKYSYISTKYSLYRFCWACCNFCNFLSKPLLSFLPSASCVGNPYRNIYKVEIYINYIKRQNIHMQYMYTNVKCICIQV